MLCSTDGETLVDVAMHVASSDHIHNSNILLSKARDISVRDAHEMCLAPKTINSLLKTRERPTVDESQMLQCRLTETEFNDKQHLKLVGHTSLSNVGA